MSLNNDYSFEIDFLPVGEESKSGDAIAMRWGNQGGFWVAVVDGGTLDAGERLVHHVKTVYGAQFINVAINTHPDGDHTSGLSVVLEEFPVRELWMHRPWLYPQVIRHLFRSGNFTTAGLTGAIRRALDCASELERIALRKGIPIREPFQGVTFGPLMVLSPTVERYLTLIPHFNNTPEPRYQSPLAHMASGGGLLGDLARLIGKAESWTNETLRDDGVTTEQNESSVVLFSRFNGTSVLLTGDAGQASLLAAWSYARSCGIDLARCNYYQVPHHGSRRNVSPALLDLLLGPKLPFTTEPTRWAVASAAERSTDHPRRAVVNAFRRRGVGVTATKGTSIRIYRGYPARVGWTTAPIMPLSNVVDD